MNGWPDNEGILDRFRDWLEEAHIEADALADEEQPGGPEPESHSVGMFHLIEEFTALRHEVKLQTKSTRRIDEQTGEAVTAIREAIDAFRSVEAADLQAARDAARPLAEAMIELDEALGRGRTVVETARERILHQAPAKLEHDLVRLHKKQSWWRRRMTRRWHDAVLRRCRQQTATVHREILDALATGYDLICRRLHRAMKEEAIYRMECVGRPADPHSMTVVEVLDDSTLPPGQIVEEVRIGYYWKGQVLRYAEVRAVRESADTEEDDFK